MKKVILFGLVCVFAVASNASASWFGDMLKRKSEPTTLSEACSSKEITAVCPETVLGEKTLSECMSENVKSLSRKCSKFVKKSIKENKNIYFTSREECNMTREAAAEALVHISADRIEKIENEKDSYRSFPRRAGGFLPGAPCAGQGDLHPVRFFPYIWHL